VLATVLATAGLKVIFFIAVGVFPSTHRMATSIHAGLARQRSGRVKAFSFEDIDRLS
jgi:hypothetical protein